MPRRALQPTAAGPRLSGAFAPEIPLEAQRPAEFVFSRHVEDSLSRLEAATGDD
jgi:hypothetical protein